MGDPFSAYINGFTLENTDDWYAQDAAMGGVVTNTYIYASVYPIPGQPAQVLQVKVAGTLPPATARIRDGAERGGDGQDERREEGQESPRAEHLL
jgi:hypothetical protein